MSEDLPRRKIGDVEFVWSRPSGHWVCQACGAMVGDYPKHGRWEAELRRLLDLSPGSTDR